MEEEEKRKRGRPTVEEKAEVKSIRMTPSHWEQMQVLKKELRSRTGKSDGEIIVDALGLYKKTLDDLNF